MAIKAIKTHVNNHVNNFLLEEEGHDEAMLRYIDILQFDDDAAL